MELATLSSGTLLFSEGETADKAYFIESGEVELFNQAAGGDKIIRQCKAGSFIAELAIFTPQAPYPYSARIVSQAQCLPLTKADIQKILTQAPPAIKAMISQLASHIPAHANLTSDNQETPMTLESGISKLRATSLGEDPAFSPYEISISKLPLKIGGYNATAGMDKRHKQNHINIASNAAPPIVSPLHCQVEILEGELHLRDLGSRFTTIVNGKVLGRGKGIYITPLQEGENTVQLGGVDSPVLLKIESVE